jgi:Cu(I)/Ag(I) efflux system membrane fusion protein
VKVAKILSLLVLSGLMLVAGCNQPAADAPQDTPAQTSADAGSQEAGGGDQEADAMAELSPADRALAEKQQVCLVSDEPLGSMGTPIKAEVQGRTVFLCCEGCQEALQEDPDKYLAKLDAAETDAP